MHLCDWCTTLQATAQQNIQKTGFPKQPKPLLLPLLVGKLISRAACYRSRSLTMIQDGNLHDALLGWITIVSEELDTI